MEKNVSNMTLNEIEEQIQQMELNKRNLEKAREQKKMRQKTDLAAKVRDMISAEGFDVAEIVALMEKKKRGGAGASKQSSGSYTTYVDPDNSSNVYVRGVLPRWMKDKMQTLHLDPGNKDHRDKFKAKHLKAVAGSK